MTKRNRSTSMHKTASHKSLEAMLEANDFKEAPCDNPIYSEGSSITFLHGTPKRSKEKTARTNKLAGTEMDSDLAET